MKIERIDDKTVKCFLSNEELEEYDIDYKDFVTRSDKAKEVVQEIIEQAEEELKDAAEAEVTEAEEVTETVKTEEAAPEAEVSEETDTQEVVEEAEETATESEEKTE